MSDDNQLCDKLNNRLCTCQHHQHQLQLIQSFKAKLLLPGHWLYSDSIFPVNVDLGSTTE